MTAQPTVAVLDYGSGNIHSAIRMLEHVGARVELTADPAAVLAADGLYVPGVGNFNACVAGMRVVGAPELIGERRAAGRPVLGVCVGMQALFEASTEPAQHREPGLAIWPGEVVRLDAPIVPHMGWSTVEPPGSSVLFDGVADQRFYFVHSYAAITAPADALVTWSEHGVPFVAAVEDQGTCATQFHPEKSGAAGAALLRNWLTML